LKLPIFSAQEIDLLQEGLTTLNLRSDMSHALLADKLTRYEQASGENQVAQIILDTTIKDEAYCADPTNPDIPVGNKCRYSFNIESSPDSDSYYFSVYNEALDKVVADCPLTGLFGVIEIKDGKPCISIGLTADENDMTIYSNNSTKLTVVPEQEIGDRSWESLLINSNPVTGLVFNVNDEYTLNDQRNLLAEIAFNDHDFGSLTVKEYGNWASDNNKWSKSVFFENGDLPSKKGTLTVSFGDESSHITSAEYCI
jgi:hypothetical protein